MTPRRALIAVALVAAVGLTVALVVKRGSDEGRPDWADCTTEAVGEEQFAAEGLELPTVTSTQVADIAAPTDLATRPGDDAFYIAARTGEVYRQVGEDEPELILTVETSLEKERGLLSLTFDPDGTHLYINYTDLEGTNQVEAYPIDEAGELGEPTTIFTSERPRGNHNLDQVLFGPDGYLYLSSGDGGVEPPADDEGVEEADPNRYAQDTSVVFGKILRIDPDPEAGGYDVPPDNPFVDDPDAAPEVWAYGFRNPWRFSFDTENDDLWIGDVGHYCWEEVDHIAFDDASGANFGWSATEGFRVHHDDQTAPDEVLPVHVYQRAEATDDAPPQCAVIGGTVYRGTALPELEGLYLYGDFCSGEVRALRLDDEGAVATAVLAEGFIGMQSLATDQEGEVYVLAADGVSRLDPAG